MNDDVDPDIEPRSEEDFQRAIRGETRPLPEAEGVPEKALRALVQGYFPLFYDDIDPDRLHRWREIGARLFHQKIEPLILRRLEAVVREARHHDSTDREELKPIVAQLEDDIPAIIAQAQDRLYVEEELAALDGEELDIERFRAAAREIAETWEPELTDE